MNAMAEAVENSEFIIMCMSDSYKQSTYCQAEAEYAFNCKRRLLPLIIRPGYRPDGWLGFMIGSRIYVDFGRFDFETGCEKLLTEISLQRKQPLASKPVQISTHEAPVKSIWKKQQKQVDSDRREKSAPSQNHQTFSIYSKRKPLSDFTRKPVTQWTESDVLDFLCVQRLIQMMPLCDGMDGRALIQLYKMSLSRSSKTYALLGDELKSTYKMKLPIGIYTRFISAMEQQLTMRTLSSSQTKLTWTTFPQQYVLPHTSSSVINNVAFQYPSYSGKPYDLLITSDAPALEVLKAVSRAGPNVEKMSSFLKHHSGRF
jgi:hypothetical protein